MKRKAKDTAKRTVRARHTIAAAVPDQDGEPTMDEATFDKTMSALLAVRWSAREWRRKRTAHHKPVR
jgi:hypothetical protein